MYVHRSASIRRQGACHLACFDTMRVLLHLAADRIEARGNLRRFSLVLFFPSFLSRLHGRDIVKLGAFAQARDTLEEHQVGALGEGT